MAKNTWVYLLTFVLLVIIVLGSLYFGNYNSTTPKERCIFHPELQCLEYQIIADDGSEHSIVNFRVKNKAKSNMNYTFNATTHVNMFGDKDSKRMIVKTDVTETVCSVVPNNGVNIAPDQEVFVTCTFDGIFIKGDKAKILIEEINSRSLEKRGEIFGTAQ